MNCGADPFETAPLGASSGANPMPMRDVRRYVIAICGSTAVSFATQLPFDRLAEWREFRRLSLDRQAESLRDPLIRKQLVDAAANGDYGTQQVGVGYTTGALTGQAVLWSGTAASSGGGGLGAIKSVILELTVLTPSLT